MTCVQHSLRTTQTTNSPQVLVPAIEDSQSVFDSEGFPTQLVSELVPSSQSLQPQSQHPQSRSLLQLQEEEEEGNEIEPLQSQLQEVRHTNVDSQPQQDPESDSDSGTNAPHQQLQEEKVNDIERGTIDRGDLLLPKEDSGPQVSSPEQSNSERRLSDQFSSSSNTEYSSNERESEKDSQLSYDTNNDNCGNLSEDKEDLDEDKKGDAGVNIVENQPAKSIKSQKAFDNTTSHSITNKTENASLSSAHLVTLPHQHQQLTSRSQRLVLAKEEQRQRLAQERRQRERQCAFPSANAGDPHQKDRNVMGSFSKRTYVDQVQRHQQRTHQRQLQMYPQQQQHHHHQPGHVLKRSNATRSNAPPPQPEETLNINNRQTHTSSSSQNLSQQQQHPSYVPSQNRDTYLTHNTNTTNNTTTEGTLYYDRLVTEEVLELKEYARLVQTQTAQLASLQSIQADLETRLEYQTVQRIQSEATLESQEIQWAERFRCLEAERDEWKEQTKKEQTKNERLLGFVNRKEKEIQKMIQRKYEPNQRPATRTAANVSTNNQSRISTLTHDVQQQQQQQYNIMVGGDPLALLRSPHEILEANASMQAGRETNATHNLLDFFGL